MKRFFFILFMGLLIALPFQNCGPGFKVQEVNRDLPSSGFQGPTPTPGGSTTPSGEAAATSIYGYWGMGCSAYTDTFGNKGVIQTMQMAATVQVLTVRFYSDENCQTMSFEQVKKATALNNGLISGSANAVSVDFSQVKYSFTSKTDAETAKLNAAEGGAGYLRYNKWVTGQTLGATFPNEFMLMGVVSGKLYGGECVEGAKDCHSAANRPTSLNTDSGLERQ